MARTYDVILFGATGFTGKLVADYFAKNAGGVKWAIAGRSRDKLEAVKRDVGLGADVPILVADGLDGESLDRLVPEARVVCTTVGPYAKYGKLLASKCARAGTHYCDLTGEVPFVRWSIDENHDAAAKSGARIVHCCGFDSIPFDLGVHMLSWEAKEKLAWAKSFVTGSKGGFSGGTVASMLNLVEEAERDRSLVKLMADRYALDPEPGHDGPDPRDRRGVTKDPETGRWTAPFLMAQVNTRVVRRSNALLHYGDAFTYDEAMSFSSGAGGLATAALVTGGLGAFVAAATFPPTRRLLAKTVLPKPGEGPSKAERDAGFFKVKLVAETETGRRLTGRVEGHGDPGYSETSKMLGEAALCLAGDADGLPPHHGVLTPASAMGVALIERLRKAGMTFAVD